MSYSFQVREANQEAAIQAATVKFDEVVTQQPVHARDREAVLANIKAAVGLLGEHPTFGTYEWVVSIYVNGYVSWPSVPGEDLATVQLSTASISASAAWLQVVP